CCLDALQTAVRWRLPDWTIKMLDGYMEVLNQKAETDCTPELCKEVNSLMKLTNKWLDVKGDA
ncbi:MAG: hypothetical protein IKK92_08965, partial [Prevotella sp.]|nr:hypothetical protein [Prevotella sp.]